MKSLLDRFFRVTLGAVLLLGCGKDDESFEEPYGEGKPPLGIVMDPTQTPVPATGLPGTEVRISATGLPEYENRLVFRFNGEEAEITDVDESGLTAIVPDYGSSGVTSVSVGDIVVFGPAFEVTGKIRVDPTFQAVNGANGPVYHVLDLEDSKRLMVGEFTNYDNKGVINPINRIVRTFSDGGYDASLRSGRGANGTLYWIMPFQDKYVISGFFSGYDQRPGNISNVTMLNNNGSIDTMGVETFRRPDQTDTIKYFPKFNGGTDGGIGRVFNHQDKLLLTGSFRYYLSRQYDKPNKYETRDTVIVDSIEMRQLVRLNADGSLDKTYRYNENTGRGLPGGNGSVGALMHTDEGLKDKVLLFGSFTTFDGQSASRIVRLNADGTIDESFQAGSGADNTISSATYNPETGKYLIEGNFRSYDGEPVERMAMLNSDGSLDRSFVPKKLNEGGGISLIKQLSDGLIVVGGSFRTYGGVTRNGFMILDETGELAPGYNATGIFSGFLADVIETRTEDNKRALLLIGGFYRFNNNPVSNIIRLVIE